MDPSAEQPWAIVVGAGPSGLLLALMLKKLSGIPVHVLEAGESLDVSPRAAFYGGPSSFELHRAGILEEVHKRGYVPAITNWLTPEFTKIAGFDNTLLDGDVRQLVGLPLADMDILLHELALEAGVQVSFNHKVLGTGQDDKLAWVDVETKDGIKRLAAPYVIGCDGGQSAVRKSLFGRNFPGFTWDTQIVATNMKYPFHEKGFEDCQYVIDPDCGYLCALLTPEPNGPGWWRVSYGEPVDLTPEQLIARAPGKFERMLPGNPKPDDYEILALRPYKIHQRVAPSFRVGRILLAADAAHLCNPFGGLGLTSGLADVGSLYDCLAGVYTGEADDSILDLYSDIRRRLFLDVVDRFTQENFRRVFHQTTERILGRDLLLKSLDDMKSDAEAIKNWMLLPFALRVDFRQYYKNPPLTEDGPEIFKRPLV